MLPIWRRFLARFGAGSRPAIPARSRLEPITSRPDLLLAELAKHLVENGYALAFLSRRLGAFRPHRPTAACSKGLECANRLIVASLTP